MTRHSKVWLVLAVLFLVVNLGGAAFALVKWELLHACIHVALVLPAAYLVGKLAARRVAVD